MKRGMAPALLIALAAAVVMSACAPRPTIPEPAPSASPPTLDSDGDGINDNRDKCPGTERDTPVDAAGCELDSDGQLPDSGHPSLNSNDSTAVAFPRAAAGGMLPKRYSAETLWLPCTAIGGWTVRTAQLGT